MPHFRNYDISTADVGQPTSNKGQYYALNDLPQTDYYRILYNKRRLDDHDIKPERQEAAALYQFLHQHQRRFPLNQNSAQFMFQTLKEIATGEKRTGSQPLLPIIVDGLKQSTIPESEYQPLLDACEQKGMFSDQLLAPLPQELTALSREISRVLSAPSTRSR